MKKFSTKMIIEGGVMIALAYILSLVKVWQAPYGGSVTAGSMIPIIIFALRWGSIRGIIVGAIYGTIQFILGPKWSFHIVSILFDYSIAFGFLGLAGLFKGSLTKNIVGIFTGISLRFVAHVISGVVVWASYAPETMSPLVYSIIYNGAYLLPEFIITVLIFILLYKPLQRIN